MNNIGSFILTGTSLSPVLLIYSLVALLEKQWCLALFLGLAGTTLVVAGVVLLTHVKKRLGLSNLTFTSVEVADRESVGMLVLYLLPLLRTTVSGLEWIILVPAGAIFLILAWTGTNYHFNPLLNFFGWTFYKVGTSEGVNYLLISRRSLRGLSNVTVGKLTEYTVIDLG